MATQEKKQPPKKSGSRDPRVQELKRQPRTRESSSLFFSMCFTAVEACGAKIRGNCDSRAQVKCGIESRNVAAPNLWRFVCEFLKPPGSSGRKDLPLWLWRLCVGRQARRWVCGVRPIHWLRCRVAKCFGSRLRPARRFAIFDERPVTRRLLRPYLKSDFPSKKSKGKLWLVLEEERGESLKVGSCC